MARSSTTVAALALGVLLLHSAEAAWLQSGADAARTGAVTTGGPLWDDVAWELRLPGSRAGSAHAGLLQDGKAYVLSADIGAGLQGLDANALWEVDLATAAVREVARFDAPPANLAGDGQHAFVVVGGALQALALPGGEPLWTWEPPALVAAYNRTTCTNPAVRNGTVFLACHQFGATVNAQGTPMGVGPTATPQEQRDAYAVAVDAATGEAKWRWQFQPGPDAVIEGPVPLTPKVTRASAAGISVIGPYVMVLVTVEAGGNVCCAARGNTSVAMTERQDVVYALAEADGAVLWSLNATQTRTSAVALGDSEPFGLPLADAATVVGATPTGTVNVAYLKLDALQAVNPARGNEIWRAAIGREDAIALDSAAGFALSDDAVFVASAQTIYRFDPATQEAAWHYTLLPEQNEQWGGPSLAVAGGMLYARSFSGLNNTLYGFDAATGEPRWKHRFEAERGAGALFRFSIGEGVALVFGQDGTLRALGRTAASLVPSARASNLYPVPGEAVTVDLGSTLPGAFGLPTAFRAEWGDGAVSEWQANPVLTHTYPEGRDVVARFQARNDANQTASTALTFFVGRPAPVELNPLQQAFSPERQEQTFFLLGLAITGAATVPGVIRLRRRRMRLQQEMRAVDAAFEQTKARPSECEAALAERRARARGLLVDGKLEQGQFHALERHIDELGKGLRLHTLDERFDFLPYGMVKTMREMLADGQVSAWERRHFLAALEQDTLLTAEQRGKVRDLVEEWFARDHAGEAPDRPGQA